MASRSGPFKTLRAAAVYAANDTWYECTDTLRMGASANTLRLYVTVATASVGNVEFYLKHSDDGTNYYDLCGAGDAPEVFGPLVFTGAASKSLEVSANLPPLEYVKVFFRASAGATSATIAIKALAFESSSATVDVATGDIEISAESIEVSTAVMDDWDTTTAAGLNIHDHDACVGASQMMGRLDATTVSEIDAVTLAASTDNLDGKDGITTAAEVFGRVDADNVLPVGAIGTILSLKTDDSSVAGTATDAGAGAVSAGTKRVTLASDDPAVALLTTIDVDTSDISTQTVDVPNVIGTDGAAGPSKTLSVAGTDGSGNLQEIKTDTDGELQVDVLTLPGGLTGHAEDDPHTTADVGIEMLAVRADAAATTADTDGDYAAVIQDASGRAWTHDPVAEALLTTIDTDTGSIATDAGTIAGDTTSIDSKTPALGNAAMAAAVPVTLASDDTNTVDLPNVIGTDGAAGPTKSLSVAGTDGSGNLQELKVDTDGELQVDVASLPGSLTGYAEDSVHSSGDIGVLPLAVRSDLATAKGADGDYVPLLVSSTNCLWVTDAALIDTNALLTTIDADTGTIAGDTTSIDSKTPALGNAAMAAAVPVTLASDDTNTVDLPNVIGTDGAAGPTKAISVAGTDGSGNLQELKVDSDGELQVDVVSMSGGGGQTEDAVHGDGDTGVFCLSVRKDAAATTADTDGDYAGLITDANGRLHVKEEDAAAIKAAVEIIDDWDESDRCAVNPISGQVGVAAGAGAVDALTQRVISATDDPGVTLLGTIDADTGSIATDIGTVAGDTTSIDGKITACDTTGLATQATLATIDTDTGNIATATAACQTALEIIDDWDDGSDHCEVVDPNRSTLVSPATGSGAIDIDTAFAADWELDHITVHLSAAAGTNEDFTIVLDANDGAAYDTTLFTEDFADTGVTDRILIGGVDLPKRYESGDELNIDWTNTDGRTYGVRIVYRLV